MDEWTDNWNGKHQQLWLSPGFAVRGPESGRAVKEGLANVSHKPCNSSRKVKAIFTWLVIKHGNHSWDSLVLWLGNHVKLYPMVGKY